MMQQTQSSVYRIPVDVFRVMYELTHGLQVAWFLPCEDFWYVSEAESGSERLLEGSKVVLRSNKIVENGLRSPREYSAQIYLRLRAT